TGRALPRSLAQQLVDRGLGAGLLVDLLDDYNTIEVRTWAAARQRLAGERTRNHHRICRHAARANLAGVAVDDLGRGADKGAHRQYRALFDNDALDDLAARADEAIVLDDDGFSLQRFEHTADPDPAREMAVVADLRAGADCRPGVDH